MTRLVRALRALVLVGLFTVPAAAHHDGEVVEKNAIRVSHAYTSPAAAMAHAINVHLTIENLGSADDRLVAAKVPFAAPGRIEASVLDEDGTLQVRVVDALTVRGGQSVNLEPGSIRLVFEDVQRTLRPGDLFTLSLSFERAGTIEMVGEVESEAGDDRTGS